jgi:hypothetical protein
MASSVSSFIFARRIRHLAFISRPVFLVFHDQVKDTPPAWGDGFSDFDKRIGANQATNIIQLHSPRWFKGSLDGNRATTVAGSMERGRVGTRLSETS